MRYRSLFSRRGNRPGLDPSMDRGRPHAWQAGRRLYFESLEDRRLLSVAPATSELFSTSAALFVENQGQWVDESVRFAHRGDGANVLHTDLGPVIQLFQREPGEETTERAQGNASVTQSAQISVSFEGANQVTPVGLDPAPTRFNFFVGEESRWRAEVPGYAVVAYAGLYEGIDLHTWGRRDHLKYEFHVAPGADRRQIRISYDAIEGLSVDDFGRLHVQTALGELIDDAPYIYQLTDGRQVEVAGRFELVDADTYSFVVTGDYDPEQELVIDPDLEWGTFLGGSSYDEGHAVAVDTAGCAYVTGTTHSPDFPVTPRPYDETYNGGGDAFVAKFDPTGSYLIYCTYLGGSLADRGEGIAVDRDGNAYVTGMARSAALATAGAYDEGHNGGDDAFLAKLRPTGSELVYFTYLGGTSTDTALDIAVDGAGCAYVTGETSSPDFPATLDAYDQTDNGYPDVFVAKLNATGSNLEYSTYLGGNGWDTGRGIAVDTCGNAYVAGQTKSENFPTTPGAYDTQHDGVWDAFVTKVNPTGSDLVYSTFLGGSDSDAGTGVAVDPDGSAYMTGWTASSDFPTTPGAWDETYNGGDHDAFVTRLDHTGSVLVYSTYLGGADGDMGWDLAVDGAARAYVTGETWSSDFPVTFDACNPTLGGLTDAFLSAFDAAGSEPSHSTYLGGAGNDVGRGVTVNPLGEACVTGVAWSADFPITPGAFDGEPNGYSDAFVAKVSPLQDLTVVPLWDGERQDPPRNEGDPPNYELNYFGGNASDGIKATVEHTTDIAHCGTASYRIDTNNAIPSAGFDFVGTALTGFGPTDDYIDTRDLTRFEEVAFWLRNDTGSAFTLKFEIKDYNDSDLVKAWRYYDVSGADAWTRFSAPLDLDDGWHTTPTEPDLSRAELFSFVIEADQGVPVDGSIYLDDMVLIEPGGPIDPSLAPVETLLEQLARREFYSLWGTRDRETGLLPAISACADVVALNTTAALVKVLPGAVDRGWLTADEANAYVELLVRTLDDRVMDPAYYLPPRHMDRVTLDANSAREESSVDAAFLYLALYQYKSRPETPPQLRADIEALLSQFNFHAFASPEGWKLAYRYDPPGFTPETYDGYSGEIWVISLAAHLADQVHITTLYHSGVSRVRDFLVDPEQSHVVHSMTEYRAPFLQWLFPLFVEVAERGLDTYPDPDPDLAANPYENAVRYQREVDTKLALLGRPTFLQSDAGDDGSGNYEQYSVYNDHGQPELFMPWSDSFCFLADPTAAENALRHMLQTGLHGPFGLVDSVHWATGAPQPYQVTARNDLWNTSLAMMALDEYLYDGNQFFTDLPEVGDALDAVFQNEIDVQPAVQFLTDSADLYARSSNPVDLASPIVPLYTDFYAGGTYGAIDDVARVTLDGNDPDAGRGLSSFRVTWDGGGDNGYFQFGIGASVANRPRDIPEFGEAEAVRFMAKGDAAEQEVRANVWRTDPGGGFSLLTYRVIDLGTDWDNYDINLPAGVAPSDLHAVQFVIGDELDPGDGTFRLDDVRIATGGFDPLRVLQSFRPGFWAPTDSCLDTPQGRDVYIYPNLASLYDNALAIKSLLVAGDADARQTAIDVTDAILQTVQPDGSYVNLRNSGHALNGDGSPRSTFSDRGLGDNSWFGLALLDVYRFTGDDKYLGHARGISDWAQDNLLCDELYGGYHGGFDEDNVPFLWRSTEHNIDFFKLNSQIARELDRLGDADASTYAARATHAGDFVMAMFDPVQGKFWTGTDDGDEVNTCSVPLDAQMWPVLTLAQSPEYADAIDWTRPVEWAEEHLWETDVPFSGFTFSNQSTPDHVWFEGTAHAAAVYDVLGEATKFAHSVQTLQHARLMHPNTDGLGTVAASSDELEDDCFGAVYDARLHVGATAWSLLAQVGLNPFAPVVGVIAGRHIFYNDSKWDGNDAGANVNDDSAIHPPPPCSDPAHSVSPEWDELGKRALLPGETASFVNYTSYSKGINGVMVDIAGLPGTPTADDFLFKTGNDDTPNDWALAPAPLSVTVRPGEGVGGSHRITIIWPNYDTVHPDPATQAVAKQWLQVTVLDTVNTGLAEPDVFYWGNAMGESGLGNPPGYFPVNAVDSGAVRDNPHNPYVAPAPICDPCDYNRDKWVNAVDFGFVRDNATNPLTALKQITAPSAASLPGPEDASVAARIDRGALHDAAPSGRQTEARGSSGTASRGTGAAELLWLDGLDPWPARQQSPQTVDPARSAVEELLATL